MLGYLLVGTAAITVIACYGCVVLALVHILFIRDVDPGDRARLGIVAFVMLVLGVALHVTISNLAGYVL